MIIGLLILLVVAVVVIRMFLSAVANPVKPPEETIRFLDFKSECEVLCNNYINFR